MDPWGYRQQRGMRDHRGSRDLEETVLKTMRVEVSTFDGRLDPKSFLDWVYRMDQYFDWYDITPHRQVIFAKMKLVRSAQLYWDSVEQ